MKRQDIPLIMLLGLLPILPIVNLQSSLSILSYGTINHSLLNLHVDGTEIKDSNGNIVKLRGLAIYAYHKESVFQINEDACKWMKVKGFNCFRLVWHWSDVETSPGVYDENYFINYLDKAVDLCEKHGIYIVFDQHTSPTKWREEGSYPRGFPRWYTDVYASDVDCASDFYTLSDPTGTGAGRVMRDAFCNVFKAVVSRYVGRNVVVGYTAINEPGKVLLDEPYLCGGQGNWGAEGYLPFLETEWGPAVRSVDPNVILVYNTLDSYWWNIKPTLPNICYGGSYYEGSCQDWMPEPYDETRKQRMIDWLTGAYNHFINELGVPWLDIEFGCDITRDNNEQWLRDYLDLMSKHFKVHWFYWRYALAETSWTPPRNPDGSDTALVPILQEYLVP